MNERSEDVSASLARLPEDLKERLRASVAPEAIEEAAPFDLGPDGRYVEGYAVIAGDRLGRFLRRGGAWEEEWHDLASVENADRVEGVGMGLLRLAAGGRLLVEFRFTLRHAKAMARVHRRIERRLGREGGERAPEAASRHPDERRVRCEKCGGPIPAWSEVCPACMSRRKILWRMLDFIRPYRARAAGAFLLALALTGLSLVEPWLVRPLVNVGFGAPQGARPHYPTVVLVVGAMAAILALRALGQVWQLRLSLKLGTLVSRSVRDQVYEHMHRLSLGFFAKHQTGALVSRVTNDTERLWYFVSSTFIELVLAILTIVGVGVSLFLMNWKLAIFSLLPAPAMLAMTALCHKRLHYWFDKMWHRWSEMTAVVADALPGVRVIKAFGQERREVARFQKESGALYEIECGYIGGVRSVFGPSLMFASGLGSLVVWLLGGWWLCRGDPDTNLGTLISFQMYLAMFLSPIHQIAHMDEMLNRAATSAQRIFDILDTQPSVYSPRDSVKRRRLEGRVELRNVSFSYDGVRKALDNVSLRVEAGTMVGLAGPSGGGKTTLVNLICRLYDVLEGQILIDGIDVRDYDLLTLRRQIGVVLQEPFLFHGTVAENIAYGNPEATLDQIIAAARTAHAHEFIVGLPDGYDTVVGERGQTLSGGERQRISIARAILNNPRILILDEATSSVDTATEKLIQDAIDHLIAERTTIAIAHRLSTLRKADRLVILEKGRVVEEGSHEELCEKEDGLYARLLRMQMEAASIIALTGSE